MDKNNHISDKGENGADKGIGRGPANIPEPGAGQKMSRRLKVIITVVAFSLLFAGGIGGGYVFFLKKSQKTSTPAVEEATEQRGSQTEIAVFFPSDGKLKSESRLAPGGLSRIEIARATIEEFLKGPQSDIKSYVPKGASLLGVYDGEDGILYIDLSDTFRRNLQVDAIAEFLLMRGIYESILANVYGVADVKILVEGAEVETLGGHLSVKRPLGETVAQTIVED